MDTAAQIRVGPGPSRLRLRVPVGVFLIAFGTAKMAELFAWPRLHGQAVTMLGLGGGTVTALLAAAKLTELLFTAFAVLALVRRRAVWLLLALAGWTAELTALAVTAGVRGAVGGLTVHGLYAAAFAGLLAATYVLEFRGAGVAGAGPGRAVPPGDDAVAAGRPVRRAGPGPSRPHDEPSPPRDPRGSAELTRRDLPVRRSRVTRRDIVVRAADVTRQDLPVRTRPAASPKPPEEPPRVPPDDATNVDPGT